MCREIPTMMRRMRNRKTALVRATARSAAEYTASLRRVTPAARSSTACCSTHGAASDTAVVTATQASPIANRRR